MATQAKWGTKTWSVSPQKVITLEKLSFSYSQVADENNSTEEKKTTNERGTELFPLTFTSILHSGAGVDIRAEIESWEALVTKVNYFYLNGKKLGPKLQLRKVAVSDVKLDDFGRMRLATLSFTFKEYNADTTSVKVTTSALAVKASSDSKEQKKTANTSIAKAKIQIPKVGSYVKPIGKKYATGQTIPDWVKQNTYKVAQVKSDRILLSGINSWVYLDEVTLV